MGMASCSQAHSRFLAVTKVLFFMRTLGMLNREGGIRNDSECVALTGVLSAIDRESPR